MLPETPVYLPELRKQLLDAAAGQNSRPPRKRKTPRRKRFIGLGVTTAAAATVATVAFIAGAGLDHQASAATVRADGMVLNSRFAVFNTPSDRNEGANPFSAAASTPLLDPMADDGRLHVNADSVHRLASNKRSLWVGATASKVCVAAVSFSELGTTRIACARPTQILDDGLFLWGHPAGALRTTELAGLVPDGVNSITITLRDGQRLEADVTDNGVTTSLPAAPVSVAFRDATNARHSAPLA